MNTSTSVKFFDPKAHVWIIMLPDYLAGICCPWHWAGVVAKAPFLHVHSLNTGPMGEFRWGDPRVTIYDPRSHCSLQMTFGTE